MFSFEWEREPRGSVLAVWEAYLPVKGMVGGGGGGGGGGGSWLLGGDDGSMVVSLGQVEWMVWLWRE